MQEADRLAGEAAVDIQGGRLEVQGATVASAIKPGINVSNSGGVQSVAKVRDSLVIGLDYGMRVRVSDAVLSGSHVIGSVGATGSGIGLQAASATVRVEKNSVVEGEQIGMEVISGGLQAGGGPLAGPSDIVIDDSLVEGHSGPAIVVRYGEKLTPKATITLQNNAELLAGNGNLVEVHDTGELKLIVDDSRLKGNLLADAGASLDVVLQNDARLTGNVQNLKSLVINSDARWRMLGDNSLPTLQLGAGRVSFRGEGFNTLTVGELSGRGVFDMRINLDNATGDLLNVTGQASGFHHVNVANTGVEVVPAEFDALRLIHTEGGNAVFELAGYNNRVDLGAYSYALEQQGTDWFIVGAGKTISPSTQSALALFNVGPTIWNSELTTLRSRMGEVRGREEGGGWMRSYGSRFNASLDSGVSYQQKQRGLSFGADAPVPVSDGHLLVGVMGGYSTSDLDMGRGSSGEVDSYYLGAYGTWLSDDGYYLDGVLKVNQFHNQSKVAMSDGAKAKGDYSNKAVGGSVEFGKHIKLPDDYFVEPFAQVSSVWVDGNSYTLDNGLKAKSNQTQSVLGKVGATLGRQFALKDGGVVQPYVRVAAAHEFSRGNDVSVNGQRFDSDVFGSRAELGAGLSVSLSERLQVHADFDYMKGEHVEQPWGANLGVRLAF
ncbi:autotransporter outer membrane beta-barrel domain-containing protein [Pseudomonas sp. NPDC088444]|uniref:autotransporter outer membrane beta-barrel domain-containing protein n=1 Tax=Pseudomonas sp. NPDC088444 TaxID=3364456 RepID=UPI00384D7A0C